MTKNYLKCNSFLNGMTDSCNVDFTRGCDNCPKKPKKKYRDKFTYQIAVFIKGERRQVYYEYATCASQALAKFEKSRKFECDWISIKRFATGKKLKIDG